VIRLFQHQQPLEAADADMAVAQPRQHGGAGGRRLVAAPQRLAGFHHAEGFGGVDAQRLEHLGGQNFAHRAFQRQPPVARAAPWGGAAALGAQIEQPPFAIEHLRKQKAAPVAQLGVVNPELVPVIAQRQGARQIAFQRLEPREMIKPGRIASPPSPTAAAQRWLRQRSVACGKRRAPPRRPARGQRGDAGAGV
jgi:hypothetical protein